MKRLSTARKLATTVAGTAPIAAILGQIQSYDPKTIARTKAAGADRWALKGVGCSVRPLAGSEGCSAPSAMIGRLSCRSAAAAYPARAAPPYRPRYHRRDDWRVEWGLP